VRVGVCNYGRGTEGVGLAASRPAANAVGGYDLGPFRAGAPALAFALAHWLGWAGGLGWLVGGLAGWWEVLGLVSGGRSGGRTYA
jgi:hypothetical protein